MNRIPSLTAVFPAVPLLLPFFLVWPLAGARESPHEPAPAASGIEHLSSKASSKLLIHRVTPKYPPIARVNYIQGKVDLEILVNREGAVVRVHILEGQPILAAAAFKAVQQWRYRPFESSNAAEPFITGVTVNFSVRFQKITDVPFKPEKFLDQQVHPPEVAARPHEDSHAERVALKVLVDADGKVLDSAPLGSPNASLEAARWNVQHWKFRPALWGALAIPWYVRIEVPVKKELIQRAESKSNGP